MSDPEEPRRDGEDVPSAPSPWKRLAKLGAAGGDTPVGCVLLVIAGVVTALIWMVVPRWRRSRTMKRRRG